jgi:signal transduction histidine kinase/CheY-like chemotaxis protein
MVRFLEQLGLSVAFLPRPGTDACLARITAFAQQEGLDPAAIEGLIIDAFEDGTASSIDGRLACLYTTDGVIVAMRDATIDGALHEVRNAVTGMAGWARIARREGGATARADDALAAIEAASMVAIDAATLARRDAEPETRERRSPDRRASVAVLIAQARELTEPLAQERGVRLDVSAPAELRVAVTRSELLSALSNLFKNAIEGSERGDRVAVGAARIGEQIAVTIENPSHGAAVPVVGKSTKGVGRGIGLGLVARIARQAEGSLGFAHSANGTVIATLTLPDAEQGRSPARVARTTSKQAAVIPAERSSRERVRAGGLASGTRPRARTSTQVLVLDDETSIRGLVTTALSLSGISAVGAAGPNELPREGTFDLALVDLRLGEYDGLVVARDLVASGRVRRIALMTGAPIGQRPHDVVAIVRKPFDLDELAARIADWTAPEPAPLRKAR